MLIEPRGFADIRDGAADSRGEVSFIAHIEVSENTIPAR